MTENKKLYYTVSEAAKMLCISRNYAYKLVRTGQLPYVKFGKRLLIPRIPLKNA